GRRGDLDRRGTDDLVRIPRIGRLGARPDRRPLGHLQRLELHRNRPRRPPAGTLTTAPAPGAGSARHRSGNVGRLRVELDVEIRTDAGLAGRTDGPAVTFCNRGTNGKAHPGAAVFAAA